MGRVTIDMVQRGDELIRRIAGMSVIGLVNLASWVHSVRVGVRIRVRVIGYIDKVIRALIKESG